MLQMEPKAENLSLALVILSKDSGCLPIIDGLLSDIFTQFLGLQIYVFLFKNFAIKICNFAPFYLDNMAKDNLDIFCSNSNEQLERVYIESGVKAGFPVPSGDEISQSLDLNKVLVQHPAATFYARVVGNSMIDAGVEEGDLLVIDRSLTPQNGSMAVCFIDGEFTLKFINLDEKEHGVIWLHPANDAYPPIKVTPDNDFVVWGIVSYTIKCRIKK